MIMAVKESILVKGLYDAGYIHVKQSIRGATFKFLFMQFYYICADDVVQFYNV